MKEMCNAIDENQLNQFVLLPRNPTGLSDEIIGKIKSQKDRKVFVEMYWHSYSLVRTDVTYSMHFQVMEKNYNLQIDALDTLRSHNLFENLIHNRIYDLCGEGITMLRIGYRESNSSDQINVQYCRRLEQPELPTNFVASQTSLFETLNTEQKSAVENILSGNNYPLPYLLYGPPGEICNFFLIIYFYKIDFST